MEIGEDSRDGYYLTNVCFETANTLKHRALWHRCVHFPPPIYLEGIVFDGDQDVKRWTVIIRRLSLRGAKFF